MKSIYLDEYVSMLEVVLSCGYKHRYSTDAIQHAISYSSYFQTIEKDAYDFAPITTDTSLIKTIYPELNINVGEIPIYVPCSWASESYLRIQEATKLTFEAIFLYLPINRMYDYFPIYHEMDFSQIVNEFKRLFSEKSILSILLDRYGYSVKKASGLTTIPYSTLVSLKKRRRDFKKTDIQMVYKLANTFRVRLETIAEIEL